MKKIALLLALFTFGFVNAQAPLEKGGIQLNGGLGSSGWGGLGYVGLDYGLLPNITIGAELSYQSWGETRYGYDYSQNALGIQANGNYHFNELLNVPSKWDVYAGASLNYYNWFSKNDDNNNSIVIYDNTPDNIGLGLHVGGRYFFTDNFGVNLQLGGGTLTSGVRAGITYKL
ncbi:outer membrane protein W [Flavobacterium sp. 7E]|uniref:outer membrane beta-barrel protein n=1 Tax=Flavobacterium sp. 7E TaxID=2735898 RepID=UPI00156FB6E0|nr:outer membrane beta-barrel protein [Flavobacterium sp. 7E]NRS88969.1 outer membrane protein W [Flavobacterium sp. 7E]